MTRPAPIDVPAFAAAQLELLAAELQAEVAQTAATVGGHTPRALQRAGMALINLVVSGRRTGMGGRTVLTVEGDAATGTAAGDALPEHGLRTGDVVLVAEQPGGSAKKREMRDLEKGGVRGVVTRVRRSALDVAVDDADEQVDTLLQAASRVWLLKLADEVTYRRMATAMRTLQALPEAGYTPLMRVLFGLSSPVGAAPAAEKEAIDWINPGLNDSQKDAVHFALAAYEVALIHGPPGTGKTHTLVELILQMVRRGMRVLVCAPSNIAVDNLVERLAPHAVPMVRLGHPARLLPSVLGHALDVLTQTSAAGAIVRDVRADMDARQAELKKPARGSKGAKGPKGGGNRRAIYAELRNLRREYRDRERRCVQELVGGSAVVLATLHGAGGSQLRALADQPLKAFDAVVIDEASQALEAQCWVPLLTARKAVLAGDHLQLPPTVKNRGGESDKGKPNAKDKVKDKAKKTAKKDKTAGKTEDAGVTLGVEALSIQAPTTDSASVKTSLEYTLFDRLLDLHGGTIKRMLTTQYRMHERIMRFPSDTLYEGKLVAADSVAARLLKDITYKVAEDASAGPAGVADIPETREPLVFIDTQGGEFPEDTAEPEDGGSQQDQKGAGPRRLLGDSKCNAMEALLVQQHVRTLVHEGGLRPADIAVITPYNAQLALLAGSLKTAFPGIELGSVDGFQGREKEAVVVSLVRSNTAGDVGFLAEKRRLNVAMTRPKRSLTVIGDSETVKHAFLKAWMEFLEENADLRYPDASAVVAEG